MGCGPRRVAYHPGMRGLFYLACIAAIGYGAWWTLVRGGCGTKGAIACPDKALDEGLGLMLARAEACPRGTYVCFERGGGFQVVRWPLAQGKLKVRVTPPEFIADPAMARQVREAAIEGIMEWDRRPFPLVIDQSRIAWPFWDINVIWQQGGGGGHARVSANPDGKGLRFAIDGVAVQVPGVRTDGPLQISADSDPGAIMAQLQSRMGGVSEREMLAMVKATAMHEMGHALGLMHSDLETDIMFPQYKPGVTPKQPSARDLRSVEALYALPNGATVQ